MKVRAVLFDLDDTLVVQRASDEAALLAACRLGASDEEGAARLAAALRDHAARLWYEAPTAEYCRAVGINPIEGLWAGFDGDDPPLRELAAWASTYHRGAWHGALAACGIDDPALAAGLALSFQEERRSRHHLFPEVHAVLGSLQQHYTLGVVTNGAPDLQREKYFGTDLAGYFETFIASGDLGIGKPDRRIFSTAMLRLGAWAEETVMVGDSLSCDILGAQNAGLRAVWIDRLGEATTQQQIMPDACLQSLSHLDALLSGWSTAATPQHALSDAHSFR